MSPRFDGGRECRAADGLDSGVPAAGQDGEGRGFARLERPDANAPEFHDPRSALQGDTVAAGRLNHTIDEPVTALPSRGGLDQIQHRR